MILALMKFSLLSCRLKHTLFFQTYFKKSNLGTREEITRRPWSRREDNIESGVSGAAVRVTSGILMAQDRERRRALVHAAMHFSVAQAMWIVRHILASHHKQGMWRGHGPPCLLVFNKTRTMGNRYLEAFYNIIQEGFLKCVLLKSLSFLYIFVFSEKFYLGIFCAMAPFPLTQINFTFCVFFCLSFTVLHLFTTYFLETVFALILTTLL